MPQFATLSQYNLYIILIYKSNITMAYKLLTEKSI